MWVCVVVCLYVCPTTGWGPLQGVVCLSPKVWWDRLHHTPHDRVHDKWCWKWWCAAALASSDIESAKQVSSMTSRWAFHQCWLWKIVRMTQIHQNLTKENWIREILTSLRHSSASLREGWLCASAALAYFLVDEPLLTCFNTTGIAKKVFVCFFF